MENKQKKFKFNIIDVIVILVILAVGVFFALRFINFEQDQPDVGVQNISYVVRVNALPKEMYDEISTQFPAQMIANANYIDGQILRAEATPCTVTDIEVRDGVNQTSLYHVAPSGEYVSVDFYCQARIATTSLLNIVGSQEVRIGRTHYIKSNDVELVGTVVSVTRSAE